MDGEERPLRLRAGTEDVGRRSIDFDLSDGGDVHAQVKLGPVVAGRQQPHVEGRLRAEVPVQLVGSVVLERDEQPDLAELTGDLELRPDRLEGRVG